MIETPQDPTLVAPTLYLWAHERWADIQRRELDNSLRVGPEKALGSYGVPPGAPIRAACPVYKLLWRVVFVERGFWHKHIGLIVEQTDIGPWFYVWNRAALTKLLNENVDLLASLGEPWAEIAECHTVAMEEGISPRHNGALHTFVQATREHKAAPGTPLYDFIADCYGDTLNPGRSDVFPGVPRERLFQAFLDVHGFPEPTGVQFHRAGIAVPGWPAEGFRSFTP